MNSLDDYSLSPATRTPRSWLFETLRDLALALVIVAIIVGGSLLDRETADASHSIIEAASYERGRADAIAQLSQTVAEAYTQGQRDQCEAPK